MAYMTIYLQTDVLERLEEIAKKKDISKSKLVAKEIDKLFKREDRREEKKKNKAA